MAPLTKAIEIYIRTIYVSSNSAVTKSDYRLAGNQATAMLDIIT